MVTKDAYALRTMKLLAQRVAILHKFMNTIGCVNLDESELIGYCQAWIIHTGKNNSLSQYLIKKGIPAIRIIGLSKFKRSEISDLGFAIANKDSVEESIESLLEDTK